jgi:hypothetical protein
MRLFLDVRPDRGSRAEARWHDSEARSHRRMCCGARFVERDIRA